MDESQLPDAAFAAVYKNANGTKIRKLPLYKAAADVPNSPDPHLVGAAEAALGAGFRGQKVQLPPSVKASARGKVAAAKARLSTGRSVSSIRLISSTSETNPIEIPESTITHFFATGRILSFFPTCNQNGFTFEASNVPESLVATLVGSTVDIQHVKKGYGNTDALVPGQDNTTMGAITQAVRANDGIYVLNKIERLVASGFGFTPEDFAPGKLLGKLSQECDYKIPDGQWIVVDKDHPDKIVSRHSYADGVGLGFPMAPDGAWAGSHVGPDGRWNYHLVAGNPVYFSVTPISFAGVGHVVDPADPSAMITKMAAAANHSFLPGMEDTPAAPYQMTWSDMDQNSTDGNFYQSDFYTHPDLLNADVSKFEDDNSEDDTSVPDSNFAAKWTEPDYENKIGGQPMMSATRAFRVKDDKGNFSRPRLIAAYRALTGMRGQTAKAEYMPQAARIHALALVRHGLNETNPNKQGVNKKVSTLASGVTFTDAQEAEIIANVEKRLIESQKLYSKVDLDKKDNEIADLKTQIATLTASVATLQTTVETLSTEKTGLTAKIAETEAERLASARYAELNGILPYSTDEKKDVEAHAAYTKSLASLSEDGFQIQKQARTIAKLTAAISQSGNTPAHMVAALGGANLPGTNPVPQVTITGTAGDNAPAIPVLY